LARAERRIQFDAAAWASDPNGRSMTPNESQVQARAHRAAAFRFAGKAGFLGLVHLALLTWLLLLPAPPADNYLAAILQKEELFLNQPEPRVVFLGGSNLAFGVDGQALRKQTKFNPVNMGLHVNIGLDLMLAHAKALAQRSGQQPREIVIFSLEFQLFEPELPNDVLVERLEFLKLIPAMFYGFSRKEIALLLDDGLVYLGGQTRRKLLWLMGFGGARYNIYNQHDFGKYGNIKLRLVPTRSKELNEYSIKVQPEHFIATLKKLQDFADRYPNEKALFAFAFPCLSANFHAKYLPQFQLMEKLVREKTNFIILGSPEDSLYPEELFFDTSYHLNAQGMTRRTEELVRLLTPLLPQLNDKTPPARLSALKRIAP
jgi:hypothetical protein